MALHIKPGPIVRTNLSLSLQWGNGLPNPSKLSEHGPFSSSNSVVSLRHEPPQVARAHTCILLLVHVDDTCRRPLRRDMPCMDCRAAAAMPGAAAAGATCAASSTLSVARCRWPPQMLHADTQTALFQCPAFSGFLCSGPGRLWESARLLSASGSLRAEVKPNSICAQPPRSADPERPKGLLAGG